MNYILYKDYYVILTFVIKTVYMNSIRGSPLGCEICNVDEVVIFVYVSNLGCF